MGKNYDRTAAQDYAIKWALSTNPDFPRYGNDCTNYVSQCLHAGGWPMVGTPSFGGRKSNAVWWYDSHDEAWWTDASYTWGGAQNFANFLSHSRRGSIVTSVDKLKIGDIVQLKNSAGHTYHTMFVTLKSATETFLSYHTSDHKNEPLSKILGRSSGTPVYWKIKDQIS